MRTTLFVLVALGSSALAVGATKTASSGEWDTKEHNDGANIVLHWVHVYEGVDTVVKVDVSPTSGKPVVLDVHGQPVFNQTKTLVAMPSCADDGCSPEIEVIDLVAASKLKLVRLSEGGQLYFACAWRGDVLVVTVELTRGDAGKGKQTTHEFSFAK
jgi:hypothetical protein